MADSEQSSDGGVVAASAAAVAPARPRHPTDPPVESVDTFSISELGNWQTFAGREPAVFGGVNPPADAADEGVAGPDEEATTMELASSPMEEQLRSGDMLADAPRMNFRALVTSTPFLSSALIVLLFLATLFVRTSVPTETYVHAEVTFANYEMLDEPGRQDLQLEIGKLMRTYPVRAEAWEMLQKRNAGVTPGFLNSGLTFHRVDALTWEPTGKLHIRVDSDDPANDVIRLNCIVEAFYNQTQARNKRLEENRKQLVDMQQKQFDLLEKDGALKRRIDELLAGAQRYMDLKAAFQATERYLELADDSNPLRLVARQNLGRLLAQVAQARGIAVERDEALAIRVGMDKQVEDLAGSIARLRRYIETFSYPQPPDPKTIGVYDTRPAQKAVLTYSWVGLVAVFACWYLLLRVRELPQAQKALSAGRPADGRIVSRRRAARG